MAGFSSIRKRTRQGPQELFQVAKVQRTAITLEQAHSLRRKHIRCIGSGINERARELAIQPFRLDMLEIASGIFSMNLILDRYLIKLKCRTAIEIEDEQLLSGRGKPPAYVVELRLEGNNQSIRYDVPMKRDELGVTFPADLNPS